MREIKNLQGMRFGRWVVASFAHSIGGHAHWNCVCDCGAESVVVGTNLTREMSKSCGCLQKKTEEEKVETKRIINKLFMRRDVAKNPEKYKAQWRNYNRKKDRKTYARALLNAALNAGKISKSSACQDCGRNIRLTAHHNNYNEPLHVEWLCYECHGKRHRKAV